MVRRSPAKAYSGTQYTRHSEHRASADPGVAFSRACKTMDQCVVANQARVMREE